MPRHDLTLADVDHLNQLATVIDQHLDVPKSAAALRDLATRIRHQLDLADIAPPDPTTVMVDALRLAKVALLYSSPDMTHYPEPVKRHADASKAVDDALRAAGTT
jgi:hypothetical protein